MSASKHLDELLQQFVKDPKGPKGVCCAIAKNSQVLYENYFGYANEEKGQPVDAKTLFRLYSMTKVITCTAAMMLFERGKFLLHDPLSEYFPEWKDAKVVVKDKDGNVRVEKAKEPILVKHALSMACGLPYPSGDPSNLTSAGIIKARAELAKKGKYTLREDIKAFSEAPLAFEPGTRWAYGLGHELVAGLVEVVSGMKISEFEKKEIFEPLGMNDTAYRLTEESRDRLCTLYQENEQGVLAPAAGGADENLEPDAVYEGGGAGLVSTLRDYLTFTQMLANGGKYGGERIIGRKTIDLMRRNQLSPVQQQDFENSYNAGYGYGLGVRTMIDPARGHSNASVGEFGWTGMAGTWTAIDPSEGVSVVYMHQMLPNREEYHHLRVRDTAFGCIE